MEHHVVVHNDEKKSIFECLVIADYPGKALDKLKNYLRDQNRWEEAQMIITVSPKRTNNKSGLLLIE